MTTTRFEAPASGREVLDDLPGQPWRCHHQVMVRAILPRCQGAALALAGLAPLVRTLAA